MRPGQNNNYKNRNRNRNRRNTGGGGGGGGGNPNNRVLDSNGPDVKLRGTAQTIAEKYMQMARDAHSSGDRVMAESYYQHADHFYRLWLAAQPAGQPLQFSRRTEEDMDDSDGAEGDEDVASEAVNGQAPDGAEGAAAGEAAGEGQPPAGDENGQNRNFRPRENRGENRGDNRDGNNRDQNGGNRFGRNRWPRRNDRYNENRDSQGAPPESGDGRAENTEAAAEGLDRNERPPRRERFEGAPATEDRGDWEAPSFLKRPVPVVAGEEAGDDVSAERKPRARRPRYGEEGVSANEPPNSEE